MFAATAAVAALLASALVENPIATSWIAIASATILPAALMSGGLRGRGYTRTFCLGALIPAVLMCVFVSLAVNQHISALALKDPFSDAPLNLDPPYVHDFLIIISQGLRYLPFGFGCASIVAGLTAVATHGLLARTSEAKGPADEAD